MKRNLCLFSLRHIFAAPVPAALALALCLVFSVAAEAQRTRVKAPADKSEVILPAPAPGVMIEPKQEKSSPGTVIDERLAVLRDQPSLYAVPMQRLRRGSTVSIYSPSKEVDGVLFYPVSVTPEKRGWLQADALVTTFRRGDEERLARLINASEGFDQVERSTIFLETFPTSSLRPAMLLYHGDQIAEIALKLTMDANKRLDVDKITATGAPMHSFFLNFSGLDRYRRLGIVFLFNANTRYFHYDGSRWKELVAQFPASNEAAEAKKRLAQLKIEMEKLK